MSDSSKFWDILIISTGAWNVREDEYQAILQALHRIENLLSDGPGEARDPRTGAGRTEVSRDLRFNTICVLKQFAPSFMARRAM